MNITASLIMLVGFSIFVLGLYYYGKADGAKECKKRDDDQISTSKNGGIAGMVLGCIILAVGMVWNTRAARHKFRKSGFATKAKSLFAKMVKKTK